MICLVLLADLLNTAGRAIMKMVPDDNPENNAIIALEIFGTFLLLMIAIIFSHYLVQLYKSGLDCGGNTVIGVMQFVGVCCYTLAITFFSR
jgi:hypothetical protein